MKKNNVVVALVLVAAILLSGCGSPLAAETKVQDQTGLDEVLSTEKGSEAEEILGSSGNMENTESAVTIYPLPDSTMDNLNDAILAISLEEGDAYVDDTGKMQMDVKIYSYDVYDMVDIAVLKEGDVLVTNSGEVKILSLERREDGSIRINGGLSENGMDLVTDDNGIFYECSYNDAKNWYEVGSATIRVSVDFEFYDASDLDQGETLYYPGSFLVGEVTNYDFTPLNTTIRVENGQIIEMHRVYVP